MASAGCKENESKWFRKFEARIVDARASLSKGEIESAYMRPRSIETAISIEELIQVIYKTYKVIAIRRRIFC